MARSGATLEIARAGEAVSNAARLVLLGHGESGKTSLQRGLRAGMPSPAEVDERTIQLDIYSLLGGANGTEQVLISMWTRRPAAVRGGLQPYMVSGSLYLLLVPAIPIDELMGYGDLVGRWMDYLTAGRPRPWWYRCSRTATRCCRSSPRTFRSARSRTRARAVARLREARHQAAQLVNDGFKPLQVQEKVSVSRASRAATRP